jgi:hypothetical protein
MTFDLTPIFQAVLSVIGLVFTTVLLPLLRDRIGAQKLAEAREWAKIAVGAAEQISALTNGKAKKAYVVDFLKSHGIDMGENELDALIEAAVHELCSFGAEAPEKAQ